MSGRQSNPSPVAIPQPSVPFLDPSGQVSRQWFYFLLGLFNRTGGSSAPIIPATLQAQINALFVEDAFTDDPGTPDPDPFLAAIFDDTDASSLNGGTFEAPGDIGTQTPGAGTFTGLTTTATPGAGQIGEYVTSDVNPAPVSLTTDVPITVASITLDAGPWDVYGNIAFAPAGTTTTSSAAAAISTVNNTPPSGNVAQGQNFYPSASPAGVAPELPTGTVHMQLTAPTTVYLIGFSQFAVSTMQAYGIISAIRTP